MYVSLIMQSGIAILASIALVLLKLWLSRGKESLGNHVQALVIATVEFQKNQCFFAGAIQIANLIYFAS